MGRRAANQSAVLFAALGILACGLSNSMKMLILSRFVGFLNLLSKFLDYYKRFLDLRDWRGRDFHQFRVRVLTLSPTMIRSYVVTSRIITSDMYNLRVSLNSRLQEATKVENTLFRLAVSSRA